jgi:sterol desaturase/sphingolipid hydroxylase (fatty acid hydroxylase superfamily)
MPHRPLLLALPLFVVIAACEGLYLQRIAGRDYDWRAFLASLGDAMGRVLINRIVGFGIAGAAFAALASHRVATLDMAAWWAWPALLLGQDFLYYWMHRADHRVHWLWATHAVHHSSNAMNFSAAYRLGWTTGISGGALFFAPLVFVGFPPAAVLAAVAINLLYQFWLHTELVPQLGPLERVLNTPAHHRVHHASNPEYIDCNFGGILIVFDRLFGTFAEERAGVPCRYGLARPVNTYNPLRIAMHGWVGLARTVRAARGLRARWAVLWSPPD